MAVTLPSPLPPSFQGVDISLAGVSASIGLQDTVLAPGQQAIDSFSPSTHTPRSLDNSASYIDEIFHLLRPLEDNASEFTIIVLRRNIGVAVENGWRANDYARIISTFRKAGLTPDWINFDRISDYSEGMRNSGLSINEQVDILVDVIKVYKKKRTVAPVIFSLADAFLAIPDIGWSYEQKKGLLVAIVKHGQEHAPRFFGGISEAVSIMSEAGWNYEQQLSFISTCVKRARNQPEVAYYNLDEAIELAKKKTADPNGQFELLKQMAEMAGTDFSASIDFLKMACRLTGDIELAINLQGSLLKALVDDNRIRVIESLSEYECLFAEMSPEAFAGHFKFYLAILEKWPDSFGANVLEGVLKSTSKGAIPKGEAPQTAKLLPIAGQLGGIFPPQDARAQDMATIVYDDLRGNGAAKPILFYDPSELNGKDSWLESMRSLGFKIEKAGDKGDFKRKVRSGRFDIIAISAIQALYGDVLDAYKYVQAKDPGAITVLGGMGALPEFARFFDYVVIGEGDIIAPTLFRFLQNAAATPLPSQKLGAKRAVMGPDGDVFTIDAPFEGRLLSRKHKNLAPVAEELTPRYERDKKRWELKYSGKPFPFTAKEYDLVTRPVPINEGEFDGLFAQPYKIEPFFNRVCFSLYAQRGCFGQCVYCSLTSNIGGRRPSVGRILRFIDQAAGAATANVPVMVGFGDELFIQDRKWLSVLLDGIEQRRHKNVTFAVQTRVDNASPELIKRMHELGFNFQFGVEALNPARIERLGKARKGFGNVYAGQARKMIELMAEIDNVKGKLKPSKTMYFMLLPARGDSVVDIASEARAHLELMSKLITEHNTIPNFMYGMQTPYATDRITPSVTGHPHAQPQQVEIQGYKGKDSVSLELGETNGTFDVYNSEKTESGHRLHGIYAPESFNWPRDIKFLFEGYEEKIFGTEIKPVNALTVIYQRLLAWRSSEEGLKSPFLKEIDADLAEIKILLDKIANQLHPPAVQITIPNIGTIEHGKIRFGRAALNVPGDNLSHIIEDHVVFERNDDDFTWKVTCNDESSNLEIIDLETNKPVLESYCKGTVAKRLWPRKYRVEIKYKGLGRPNVTFEIDLNV